MHASETKITYDTRICFGTAIVDRRMNALVDKHFSTMITLNRTKVRSNEVPSFYSQQVFEVSSWFKCPYFKCNFPWLHLDRVVFN